MAIGATAHKLILDSTKFVEGASLSRKELGFLKQTMMDTATPAEKLASGITILADLHKKGALSAEQHERALAKLHDELTEKPISDTLVPEAKSFERTFLGMLPVINPVSLALKGLKLASHAIGDVFRMVGNAAEFASDRLAKQRDVIREAGAATAIGEERFGGFVSALDVRRVEQFDIASANLASTFDSLTRRAASELAPAFTHAIDSLQGFADQNLVIDKIGNSIQNVADVTRGAVVGVKLLADEIMSIPAPPRWMLGMVPGATTVADAMSGTIDSLRFAGQAERFADKFRKGKPKPFDMGPGPEGVAEGSDFGSIGSVDRMYEEDRAMEAIVDKYKKRRIELELTGPFLEIHRAKLDGLKGAELEAFKMAIDKDEMEKLRVRRLDEELKKKKEIRDVDIDIIRVGSREEAQMFARSVARGGLPAGGTGGGKITTDSPATLARLDKIAKHTAEKIVVHEITL